MTFSFVRGGKVLQGKFVFVNSLFVEYKLKTLLVGKSPSGESKLHYFFCIIWFRNFERLGKRVQITVFFTFMTQGISDIIDT